MKKAILVACLAASFCLGLWAFTCRYDWDFSSESRRFTARGLNPHMCRSNLRALGMILSMYVNEHGLEKLPESLESLAEEYIYDPGLLRCPYSPVEAPEGWKDPEAHYEYCGRGLSLDSPPDTPVVKERRLNHFASYERSFFGEPSTGLTIFEVNVLRLDGTVRWQEEKFEVTEEDVAFIKEVSRLRGRVLPLIDKVCFISFYVVLFGTITLCIFVSVSPKRRWEAHPVAKGALCGASVAGATSLLLFGYSFFFGELARLSVHSLVMSRFYYVAGLPAVVLGDLAGVPSSSGWQGVLVVYCLGIWLHHVFVGTVLGLGFLLLGKLSSPGRRRPVRRK